MEKRGSRKRNEEKDQAHRLMLFLRLIFEQFVKRGESHSHKYKELMNFSYFCVKMFGSMPAN